MFRSVPAFQKMFVKIVGFIEESVTTRASKAPKENIYIFCMTNMVPKSQ